MVETLKPIFHSFCAYFTNINYVKSFNTLKCKIWVVVENIFLMVAAVALLHYSPHFFVLGFAAGITFPEIESKIARIWKVCQSYPLVMITSLSLTSPVITIPFIVTVLSAKMGVYLTSQV